MLYRLLAAVMLVAALAGCATDDGQDPVDKVLSDFGLQERPEGYVSGTDQVYGRLPEVGATEMKRLNLAGRHGEVKAQQEGLKVQYYKSVRVYEIANPIDAQPTPRTSHSGRGYAGYIEYRYSIYESPRFPTQAEAEVATADIPTGEMGSETYRYDFTAAGIWDGRPGERSRQ